MRPRVIFITTAAFAIGLMAFARAVPATDVGMSGFGLPLDGLSSADLDLFVDGQKDFVDVESLPTLGPIFNARSCGGCHFQPALGGSGEHIQEVRIRNNPGGGPLHIFGNDNILRLGPQSQDGNPIFESGLVATPLGCQMTSPKCRQSRCQKEEAGRTTFRTNLPICDPTSAQFASGANCTAERQATPLFGFGLIEAVADATIQAIAAGQPGAIQGTVKIVREFNVDRVARFGWKNDIATLRAFAGGAYLNEMGITNPDNPNELSTCALGKMDKGVLLDAADDPEDQTDQAGRADTDKFADFQRMLAPPPTLPQSAGAMNGHTVFNSIGCDGCHVETLTTAADPSAFVPPTTGNVAITTTLNSRLASATFHPFSDFLLHDMGSLGDGITSGAATPTKMRTAPLWGVRAKSRLLHDGRAEDPEEAIKAHDGQGAASRNAFNALSAGDQADLLEFLGTI